MTILIGLTGKIGSGKSLLSDYIQSKYSFKEYSFAKPLKDIAMIMGFEAHEVFGTQTQKMEPSLKWGISGRAFLQKFGTDICRDVLPSIIPEMKTEDSLWIKLCDIFLSKTQDNIVITDCRFVDESNFIREKGGIVIKLERENEHNKNDHKSENYIDSIKADYIINNNYSDKEELFKHFDTIMESLK